MLQSELTLTLALALALALALSPTLTPTLTLTLTLTLTRDDKTEAGEHCLPEGKYDWQDERCPGDIGSWQDQDEPPLECVDPHLWRLDEEEEVSGQPPPTHPPTHPRSTYPHWLPTLFTYLPCT